MTIKVSVGTQTPQEAPTSKLKPSQTWEKSKDHETNPVLQNVCHSENCPLLGDWWCESPITTLKCTPELCPKPGHTHSPLPSNHIPRCASSENVYTRRTRRQVLKHAQLALKACIAFIVLCLLVLFHSALFDFYCG